MDDGTIIVGAGVEERGFEIIEPKPLVDALDAIYGYYDGLTPFSPLVEMEADCADLFPVIHGHFGDLTRREWFNYFAAWLECEKLRNPSILATIYDQTNFGPRIITPATLH